MTRPVPSWSGRAADSAPPPRVIARLFERQEGRCAVCTRKLGVAGERWECDHTVALVNGGTNTEENLRLLCRECHRGKTAEDVAEKASVAAKRAKHRIGVRRKSRLPGSRDSGWKRKIDGTVERRDG